VLAIVVDNVEELVNGLRDVLEEVTNGGGLLDDGANGAGDGAETETGDESSNLRGELEEELLGVGTGDGQGGLDGGSNVVDDLTTLEVLADGGNNGTEGSADTGETETRDESSDGSGELNEESTDISTNNGDETVNGLAEGSDEATETGGRGDNGTERNTEAGEAKAGDEGSDLGGELNEQGADIRTGDGQDVVELGTEVLDNVAIRDSGDSAGGGSGGNGLLEGLGEVTLGQDLGELAEVELLEDITNVEVVEERLEAVGRGRGSESTAGHGGDGSDERGLHCELRGV
jgi:hypothetical protein